MTTVAIHIEGAGFQDKWAEFLEAQGVEVRRLDFLAPQALQEIRVCDGAMWHFKHEPDDIHSALPLLHVVETECRIPVFPNLRTAWHFDNKIAQAHLLRALNIPTPQSWVFWREGDALAWAEQADYPVVFKLASGAGSANVSLVRDVNTARRKIRRMFSRSGFLPPVYIPQAAGRTERLWRHFRHFALRLLSVPAYVLFNRYPPLPGCLWMPEKNYVLFQEYVSDNTFDTRVTVIGDRAFAFRRMNRPGDFRASGSGRIEHDPEGIDPRCVKLAFDAAAKLGMQSVAFDFLLRGAAKDPVVLEVSYGYLDSAVEQCSGHWDSDLHWHEGHMWPEEAQVEDFLRMIDSNQDTRSV